MLQQFELQAILQACECCVVQLVNRASFQQKGAAVLCRAGHTSKGKGPAGRTAFIMARLRRFRLLTSNPHFYFSSKNMQSNQAFGGGGCFQVRLLPIV